MFQTVKLNILIPLQYDREKFPKTAEENPVSSKEIIDKCRAYGNYGCAEWFHYCFRNKPIENNFQMVNSPLVMAGDYRMSRVEMNGIRSLIGLHHNETAVYTLVKNRIDFTVGKIRILFTQRGIAFLHLEVFAADLEESEVRIFIHTFSQITGSHPGMTFKKKVSIDMTEEIKVTFKEIILNILNLQSYIPVSLYNNRITPYIQICLIGSCEKGNEPAFFDSVQALSSRASSKSIDQSRIYIGREDYVRRFAGDRTVCIYGDTETCGPENLQFITDTGNGLVKTATENYATVYAFLISLHLLLRKNDKDEQDMKYLLNAPSRLSDEDNIREFFEQCLWDAGWNLRGEISDLKEKNKTDMESDNSTKIMQIWEQADENRKTLMVHGRMLEEISGEIHEVHNDVSFLANFVKNELKAYLKEEKDRFRQSGNSGSDVEIGAFIEKTSSHIDEKIVRFGDDIVKREREGLEMLFGDKWEFLMPTSQTSLVSAGALLKQCADIKTPDFDYSGICICCTAALEAELKRVFFDGLMDYMVYHYGEPGNDNAPEIYENWPDALLTVSKYRFTRGTKTRLKKVSHFTMGTLPFLFGEFGKLSGNPGIRTDQLAQSELMKKRMSEYLSTIVNEEYQNNPFEAFYVRLATDTCVTGQVGCFVWKCEKIRKDYRNKAAHVNVMSEKEASSCYQSIITKPDTYVYKAGVTGVILELFSKIDGSRLKRM